MVIQIIGHPVIRGHFLKTVSYLLTCDKWTPVMRRIGII